MTILQVAINSISKAAFYEMAFDLGCTAMRLGQEDLVYNVIAEYDTQLIALANDLLGSAGFSIRLTDLESGKINHLSV